MSGSAQFTIDQQQKTLYLSDNWTIAGITELAAQKPKLPALKQLSVDGKNLKALDSAGTWLLLDILKDFKQEISWQNFTDKQSALITLVQKQFKKVDQPLPEKKPLPPLEKIGQRTIERSHQSLDFIAFIGEILWRSVQCIRSPHRFEWRSFLNVIDYTGFCALGIVGLLSFSIGVVLAYQMGQQLKIYGANIYIISMLGLGVLQEFAPLITAIIIAGRTSSAFTAEIGSMKINEEIDALQTMGLSPVERLAIPKIFALIVTLPLLVIWADIFGLLGGMLIAKHSLNINYYNFILRFPIVVELRTFLQGLLKAPFFALIISTVGCFRGFQVTYSSESVGQQTTKSVVQAIFWIILVDSVFSVILPWQSIE